MKKLLFGMLALLLALGMFVGCNNEESLIPGDEIHPSIQGDWVEAAWGYNTNLPVPQNASNAIEWYVPGQVNQAARYMFGPRDLVTFAPGNSAPASTNAGLTRWTELATNYNEAGYTKGIAEGIPLVTPREWILAKPPRVQTIILSGDSHFMTQMYQPTGITNNAAKLDRILTEGETTWRAFPDLIESQHVIDGEIAIFDFSSGIEIGKMYFLLVEMAGGNRNEDVMHVYAVVIDESFTGNYPTTKGAYVRPSRTDPNNSIFIVDVVFNQDAFVVASLSNTPAVLGHPANGAMRLLVRDPAPATSPASGPRINEIDRSKFEIRNMTMPSATLAFTEVLKGIDDPVNGIWAANIRTCRYSLIMTGLAPGDPVNVPRTAVAATDVIKITVEAHTNGVYYFPAQELFVTLPVPAGP